jgi:hypothetical protein
VIFFFELNGKYTRCEVLPRPDGTQELIVTPPDGGATTEILMRSADVPRRILELRETMASRGWWGPIGREI